MCHNSCIQFGTTNISKSDIEGKSVLEVGSLDINGSLRPFVNSLNPSKYIGVDVTNGNGVDLICNVYDIVNRFGKESFDILIATELLEHICYWRKAVHNFKQIIKPNGILILTTRSKGFRLHGYPHDYWRFECEDIKHIFSDFFLEILVKDPSYPGVFLKAKKPNIYIENDISDYNVYSIIKNCPINSTSIIDFQMFRIARFLKRIFKYPS